MIFSHSCWGGQANAIVDIVYLSVRASARCVLARRITHIDAMNIQDSSAKNELLKVPLEGGQTIFWQSSGNYSQIFRDDQRCARDIQSLWDTIQWPETTGKASDRKFKRLDKPSSYGSGGIASVVNCSYRNTENKKPDAYRLSG